MVPRRSRNIILRRAIEVWHIFVLVALLGLTNAFDISDAAAFLVDIVRREDLTTPSRLILRCSTARASGAAVAGLLIASVGEAWCFGMHAVSYVGV
jgi:hypothetical protein